MRSISILFILLVTTMAVPAQWNSNTSVNLEVAGLNTGDMQPVVTSSGKTWVAYYHSNAGSFDMRAQLLDVNGNKLLGPNGVLVSNKPTGSASFVFNICTDAADNLIICAQDQRAGGGVNKAVAFKVGLDGSLLWGTDGIVLGNGLSPYPAALSNGEVVIAWNETASNTLNIHKVTTAGTLAWAIPVVVKVGTALTTRGQLIANSAGTYTMVFQRRGVGISTTLYAQRYANDGTALWAAPLQLGNQTTSGARYYSIASEKDTTYFGYYSSQGSRFNSFLQRINPDGTIPWGMNGSNFNTAVAAADPYQQMTNIALTPGSPYVWSMCTFSNSLQNQYGIYVQKFSKADGSRQFGATAKNVYPISPDFDTQAGPVSLVNDAPVFMHYDVNYKIYATRLDAAGNFVWTGNKVELSSTTATLAIPKGRFGFASWPNNQAIAVWYENRAGEYRPYAQNITPGGLFFLKVATQSNVTPAITINAGTLQMTANVFPATANQQVTWSMVPVTGAATINTSGLVTAQANGTVWAKAVSVQDNSVKDSMLITISGQIVPATGLVVRTLNNVPPAIGSTNSMLQMVAIITPPNATYQDVTWSIVPVTGQATISATGLVTPVDDGTVWAKAVSVAYPNLKDSMLITISGQWTTNFLTGIQIYPIPTSDELHLKLFKNHRKTNMRIVDMSGRVVYWEVLAPNALRTEKVISLKHLPAGLYILRFSGGVIYTSFKIEKQ